MEKDSALEPGFCSGLCRWEIHTLILLNIKKGPETGRQPSFFNPVSMGYHWNKTWKGLSPRTCSGKREQTHVTGKGTNDTFGPASTQCEQAITRHVILRKMYRTTFSCYFSGSSTPYEQSPIFCLRWIGDSTWLKPLRSPQPKISTSQSRSLSSHCFFFLVRASVYW